jgi:hypothetical protein
MGYFRELPDLAYQSFLPGKNSSQDYVITKNLFRRVKLRDDLYNVFTIFNKYQIKDGARPDTVADEIYGSPELDWVVLTTANIINVRDQWPLSNYQIYNYAENKYGSDLTTIRFYETTEVKDSSNRLILPAGKVVDKNFTIPDPDDGTKTLSPVTGITNYEYETIKNDEKRSIYLLKPAYLQQFLNDMRTEMLYSESSEYITDTLIQTQNTNITLPQ